MIDFEKIKVNLGGDEEIVRSYFKAYLKNYPERKDSMLNAAREMKDKDGFESTHTLKGVISYFASDSIIKRCVSIEQSFKIKDFKSADEQIVILIKELEPYNSSIAKYIKG